MYTSGDVQRICKEQNIHFIRLQFTDIFGTMKSLSITADQLERALCGDIAFDGSSIEGFARIEESDMVLLPDPSTFVILPWLEKENTRSARMICDVYTTDGSPFKGDPRRVLKNACEKAAEMGYTMKAGTEAEFFLFERDSKGRATTITSDEAAYFDLDPVDMGEDARRDICIRLKEMGFEVEAGHHESAPGQHEIDFKYADALTTADNVMTFKLVVRMVARTHGLHATFMPKPINGIAGSGMHINQSLHAGDVNLFSDSSDEIGLSNIGYSYIAGIMEHARGMAAVTNPLVNSYKRLISGFEAPVYIAWATKNRSPLIRVPASRGGASRIELRNPDPACNPYLALAVALRAGLDGIERGLTPPERMDCNLYELDRVQRAARRVGELPKSLEEALDELMRDPLMRDALGDHVIDTYASAKYKEWDSYRTNVSQWEVDNYLARY